MAEVTISFDLETERHDLQTALDAPRWRIVVLDIDQHLRDRSKYGELSEETRSELEAARKVIFYALEDLNLKLD